jgi:hypothetical protein
MLLFLFGLTLIAKEAEMVTVIEPKNGPLLRARLWIGGGILFTAQLAPLLIPFVLRSSLSGTWKTFLSGLLAFGLPELGLLLSIGILGKDGYDFLKEKIFGFFKREVFKQRVSPGRYRFGLVLFTIPLILAWAGPYLFPFIQNFHRIRYVVYIGGDVMLMISVIVLGGDFWEKLRGLFTYRSKA